MTQPFQFRDVWVLDAPPGTVFDLLADVDGYPRWWPQIRSVRRIDDESGELVCRSVLPYDLHLTVRRDVQDRGSGLLRVLLDGDLVGRSGWLVDPAPGSGAHSCRAEFTQQVTAPGVPGGGATILRPVLDWNHAVMMRAGVRGLRRYLANLSRSCS